MHLDSMKKQIDLSLTKISKDLERKVLESYKQVIRTRKLLEVFAKQRKQDPETVWNDVAEPLFKKFDSLYEAFQAIALNGEKELNDVPKKYHKALLELVEKNIVIPKKTVKGVLSISSTASNAVELIKKALVDARKSTKDAGIQIYYLGSGKVTSLDYRVSERVLKFVSDNVLSAVFSFKGKGDFKKI